MQENLLNQQEVGGRKSLDELAQLASDGCHNFQIGLNYCIQFDNVARS